MTDKEKYDFIDHVVHLTLSTEDRLLNEHGGKYSGLQEDGIDSNEYYRIITERVINILKKNKNYMQEEPVSEDLEKAAKNYAFTMSEEDEVSKYYAFLAGANWQLAKNKSITLDDLEKFINELSKQFPEVSFAKVCKIATRTAKWQKQQMMAKAIEGNVLANGMGEPILHLWDKGKYLINKKVKVIVIKED